MPAKAIEERIKAAFHSGSPDHEFGEKYLDLLYANWCAVARALRRTSVLLVGLVVAFLSLAYARNTEFTLGPLRLTNISSVLVLVPAIVSLLAYEFFVLGTARIRYRDTIRALVQLLHPSVSENDLQLLLEPPTASLWSDEGWLKLRESEPGIASKLIGWGGNVVLFSLVLGTLAFLVYAYVTLYENSHANTLGVTASLVFAVFNGVRGVLVLADS